MNFPLSMYFVTVLTLANMLSFTIEGYCLRIVNPSQILGSNRVLILPKMAELLEFADEAPLETDEKKTDEELAKTHGYEGNFKIGDSVKVNKSIRIWSVKEYSNDGFDCNGYEGKVTGLALYGRKYKSLCSAITPVKVEFQPDGKSVPVGMFTRKWVAHFASNELELI